MPWILGIWTVSHDVHKCSHSLSQLFSSNIHILNMHWSFDKGLCPNTFLNKIKASPQKAQSSLSSSFLNLWFLASVCQVLGLQVSTTMPGSQTSISVFFCLPDIIIRKWKRDKLFIFSKCWLRRQKSQKWITKFLFLLLQCLVMPFI